MKRYCCFLWMAVMVAFLGNVQAAQPQAIDKQLGSLQSSLKNLQEGVVKVKDNTEQLSIKLGDLKDSLEKLKGSLNKPAISDVVEGYADFEDKEGSAGALLGVKKTVSTWVDGYVKALQDIKAFYDQVGRSPAIIHEVRAACAQLKEELFAELGTMRMWRGERHEGGFSEIKVEGVLPKLGGAVELGQELKFDCDEEKAVKLVKKLIRETRHLFGNQKKSEQKIQEIEVALKELNSALDHYFDLFVVMQNLEEQKKLKLKEEDYHYEQYAQFPLHIVANDNLMYNLVNSIGIKGFSSDPDFDGDRNANSLRKLINFINFVIDKFPVPFPKYVATKLFECAQKTPAQALVVSYANLKRNYQEPSFLKWAFGVCQFYGGGFYIPTGEGVVRSVYLTPMGRYCTYQLARVIDELPEEKLTEALDQLEEMGRCYGKDKEKAARKLQEQGIDVSGLGKFSYKNLVIDEVFKFCSLYDTPPGREINANILKLVAIKRIEHELYEIEQRTLKELDVRIERAINKYAGDKDSKPEGSFEDFEAFEQEIKEVKDLQGLEIYEVVCRKLIDKVMDDLGKMKIWEKKVPNEWGEVKIEGNAKVMGIEAKDFKELTFDKAINIIKNSFQISSLANWAPRNFNEVRKIIDFLNNEINEGRATEADVMNELIPEMTFRTQALVAAYFLLKNGDPDSSFVRWAFGICQFFGGQKHKEENRDDRDGNLQYIGRYATYQLAMVIKNSQYDEKELANIEEIGRLYGNEEEAKKMQKKGGIKPIKYVDNKNLYYDGIYSIGGKETFLWNTVPGWDIRNNIIKLIGLKKLQNIIRDRKEEVVKRKMLEEQKAIEDAAKKALEDAIKKAAEAEEARKLAEKVKEEKKTAEAEEAKKLAEEAIRRVQKAEVEAKRAEEEKKLLTVEDREAHKIISKSLATKKIEFLPQMEKVAQLKESKIIFVEGKQIAPYFLNVPALMVKDHKNMQATFGDDYKKLLSHCNAIVKNILMSPATISDIVRRCNDKATQDEFEKFAQFIAALIKLPKEDFEDQGAKIDLGELKKILNDKLYQHPVYKHKQDSLLYYYILSFIRPYDEAFSKKIAELYSLTESTDGKWPQISSSTKRYLVEKADKNIKDI